MLGPRKCPSHQYLNEAPWHSPALPNWDPMSFLPASRGYRCQNHNPLGWQHDWVKYHNCLSSEFHSYKTWRHMKLLRLRSKEAKFREPQCVLQHPHYLYSCIQLCWQPHITYCTCRYPLDLSRDSWNCSLPCISIGSHKSLSLDLHSSHYFHSHWCSQGFAVRRSEVIYLS